MENDVSDVGHGRTYNDAVEKHDAEKGKHVPCPCADIPEDTKLPTGNMPKAPDPTPFQLGPMAPGSRE